MSRINIESDAGCQQQMQRYLDHKDGMSQCAIDACLHVSCKNRKLERPLLWLAGRHQPPCFIQTLQQLTSTAKCGFLFVSVSTSSPEVWLIMENHTCLITNIFIFCAHHLTNTFTITNISCTMLKRVDLKVFFLFCSLLKNRIFRRYAECRSSSI